MSKCVDLIINMQKCAVDLHIVVGGGYGSRSVAGEQCASICKAGGWWIAGLLKNYCFVCRRKVVNL